MRVTMSLTTTLSLLSLGFLPVCAGAQAPPPAPASHCSGQPPASAVPAAPTDSIDLVARLTARQLKASNRQVTAIPDSRGAVHVSDADGPGVAWIQGSDFADGTISIDVCGRDVYQQSFVGVAFHGQNDNAYEAVYLRPFNFRATMRHGTDTRCSTWRFPTTTGPAFARTSPTSSKARSMHRWRPPAGYRSASW